MTNDSAAVMTNDSAAVMTQPPSKLHKAAELVGVIVTALCVVIGIGVFVLFAIPGASIPDTNEIAPYVDERIGNVCDLWDVTAVRKVNGVQQGNEYRVDFAANLTFRDEWFEQLDQAGTTGWDSNNKGCRQALIYGDYDFEREADRRASKLDIHGYGVMVKLENRWQLSGDLEYKLVPVEYTVAPVAESEKAATPADSSAAAPAEPCYHYRPCHRTPAGSSAAAPELPTFAKRESYASVRTKMLAAGWAPFYSKDADPCLEDDSRCIDRSEMEWPEMESCAATGLSNCRFLWKKDEKITAICTIGETNPMFDVICNHD
jgi:hypothetical protein